MNVMYEQRCNHFILISYFFCGSLVVFINCVSHAFASVRCCLVVTQRKMFDLLALVCDVYCDFVTFPFGILGHVCHLIVSNPDPCSLSYLAVKSMHI